MVKKIPVYYLASLCENNKLYHEAIWLRKRIGIGNIENYMELAKDYSKLLIKKKVMRYQLVYVGFFRKVAFFISDILWEH